MPRIFILLNLVQKNKVVLTNYRGGKIERRVSSFLESIMEAIVVSLEHGTYLRLILQLVNSLAYESYKSHESSHSFGSQKERSDDHPTMFWSISQTSQCCQVFFHASQCSRGVSFQTNHMQYCQFPFLCQSTLI
jgi:hypothetical protein